MVWKLAKEVWKLAKEAWVALDALLLAWAARARININSQLLSICFECLGDTDSLSPGFYFSDFVYVLTNQRPGWLARVRVLCLSRMLAAFFFHFYVGRRLFIYLCSTIFFPL